MEQGAEDKALIGILTTDNNLFVQVWDDAMSSFTGVGAESAVGKHLTELIPDLESRGLLDRFERVLNVGTNEVLAAAFHRYLVRCDPLIPARHFTDMQQLVTISPLRTGDEISGVMVMIEDVTERLDSERELAVKISDPDDTVRLNAAKEMATASGPLSPQSTNTVIGALGDRNWRVRRTLVEGLSKRITPDAIGSLLEAFRDGHLDFGLLNSALKVLQGSSPDTMNSLADFLQGEDTDLRIQAALALGELNNPTAVPYLLEALDDGDSNVRYHAIEALGKFKAREAVEPLLSIVKTRDFFLAFPALEALARIGDDGIVAKVLPLLEDEDLRDSACETLGAVGGLEIVEPIAALMDRRLLSVTAAANAFYCLSERLTPEKSAEVSFRVGRSVGPVGKLAVLKALDSAKNSASSIPLIRFAGWSNDPEIRDRLSALVDASELRDEAVKALASHGEAAVEHFIDKLESGERELRLAALRALGEFKGPAAVQALISALQSDDESAATAARSLGQIGDPASFDALVEVLSKDSKTLRLHAVQALKSVIRPEMGPKICALLDRMMDSRVREALIRAIGAVRIPECDDAIVSACEDGDPSVRAAAVDQLAGLETERAVPLLERSLGDREPRVRVAAARALGRVGGTDAARALRSSVGDEDAWTRYFAVRSLAQLNDPESEGIFKTLAQQDDAEQVRAAAAEAISAG